MGGGAMGGGAMGGGAMGGGAMGGGAMGGGAMGGGAMGTLARGESSTFFLQLARRMVPRAVSPLQRSAPPCTIER